jgi:competence protein ComEA
VQAPPSPQPPPGQAPPQSAPQEFSQAPPIQESAPPAGVTPQPPATPQPTPQAPAATSPGAAQQRGTIHLNAATFEQLRAEGLSVTQATRLLAHRERVGRFNTVDDLDQIPGLPQDFLQDLKSRSTV